MIVWAFLSLSVIYVTRQPTVHSKGYCFQHMFWLQAFSWMDWNLWSGKTSVWRIYCKYGLRYTIFLRVSGLHVLSKYSKYVKSNKSDVQYIFPCLLYITLMTAMHDCIHTRTCTSKVQQRHIVKMAANLNVIEKIITGFAIWSVQEQGLLGHEYCRLTKKKVLDCRWHKKGVIEFKFMKKPRAICMSSRLRWKGYIISIFVDGNAFVFFPRCGVSSSGIRWHLRGLQFQDSQGFKARRKAIWILYGYWNFFASICKWILVTKRYNSLWETWPKMWTSMALISNVWYSDGQ